MDSEHLRVLGEHVDRLITTDAHCRPIILPLYDAARQAQANEPLAWRAAQRLLHVIKPERKDVVLIISGFLSPTLLRGEQDGPVGAAWLARGLAQGFEVKPVLITDPQQIPEVSATSRGAGLNVYHNLDEGLRMGDIRGKSVSVISFPIDDQEAKEAAAALLEQTKPAALIAVERPSGNEHGIYHNIHGLAMNHFTAKTDYLFQEAQRRNILTVAIGDGGNELGCGMIYEQAQAVRPNGARCRCECNGTVLSNVGCDALVWSSISDWGALGLLTCLAALSGRNGTLPTTETAAFTLQQATFAGLHDGMGGWLDPGSDGISWQLEVGVLALLHKMLIAVL